DEPIVPVRERNVRREERVVDRGQTLLAIEDDVLAMGDVGAPVYRLTGERFEVLPLSLPEKEASDVVVEEDGLHELANVPRPPLKVPLEVWNYEAPLAQEAEENVQADVIGLLGVLHSYFFIQCGSGSDSIPTSWPQ